MEPLLMSVAEAARFLGISRWSIFQGLRDGKLSARKFGRRTLVTVESFRRHAETLPVAQFGTQRIEVPSEPKRA